LAGALSGYFLQGTPTEPTGLENGVLQGLAGIGSGATLMLAVGLVRHRMDRHKK
jgi:hypothetical protein